MNTITDIERSITSLTEIWENKKSFIEETGLDEETGYAIFTDDGYQEYLAVWNNIAKYISEVNIQEVAVTLKNHISKLDSERGFSFSVSFLSLIIHERIEAEQSLYSNDKYLSISIAHSNLRVLESIFSGVISSYFSSTNGSVADASKYAKANGIKKPMEIKDFLMWVRIPVLTKRLELEKGHLIEFITAVGNACGLEIKKGYASNIYEAIANKSYHEMINDLIAFVKDYERSFNEDQSRKKEDKFRKRFDQNPSGIKWNNN